MTIPEPPAYQPTAGTAPRRRTTARTIAIAACTGLAVAAGAAAATGAFDTEPPSPTAYQRGYLAGQKKDELKIDNPTCLDALNERYSDEWMSGCEDAAKGMTPADGSVRVEEGKKSPVTGVVVDCTPGGMYSSTKSPTGAMNRLTASIKLTNPSKDSVSFTVHVDGSPIENSSTKATDVITMEGGSYKTFTYLAPEENSAMGSCMAMTVTTHTAKTVTGFKTK